MLFDKIETDLFLDGPRLERLVHHFRKYCSGIGILGRDFLVQFGAQAWFGGMHDVTVLPLNGFIHNSGDTLPNYRSFWGLASVFLKFDQSFPQVMTKSCLRQVVCRFAHVCWWHQAIWPHLYFASNRPLSHEIKILLVIIIGKKVSLVDDYLVGWCDEVVQGLQPVLFWPWGNRIFP